jgi:alpha-beta hydrolase superfamily lysophospholipase
VTRIRRAGLAAAIAGAPLALAYRFAIVYRQRAGIPRPRPPQITPAAYGLVHESLTLPVDDVELPAWFIPARGGEPGPGVLLVHGWESSRDRTLPLVRFLHAAGFHCLTFDVRGHGANPPETLPVTAGEFGRDALVAFHALVARPEVTSAAIAGHSLGGIGALLAAAAEPDVAAVVATSAPSDPGRLTRQTFRLAHLPIPDVVAYPLAWFTARVFLRPRGHRIDEVSAASAIRRYRGPVLVAHGSDDAVVPVAHQGRLVRAAERGRADRPAAANVESLVIDGGQHSWLYEFPEYRAAVARFLASALGGPLAPGAAADAARAVEARRLDEEGGPFSAVEDEPGGLRSMSRLVPGRRPGNPALPVDAGADLEPGPPATVPLPGLAELGEA